MYMLENVPMDALLRDRVPSEPVTDEAHRPSLNSVWAYAAALATAIGDAVSRAFAGYGWDYDDDDPLPPTVVPPMLSPITLNQRELVR